MLKIALIIVLVIWGGSFAIAGMMFITSSLSKRMRNRVGP